MAKYVTDERLTDDIIEKMLNECGLELKRDQVSDGTGKPFVPDPIMRGENSIMIRCKNSEKQELMRLVYKRFPNLALFGTEVYQAGDELVMLEDFFATRMRISEDIGELDRKLFQKHYETMAELFGEEYEADARTCYEETKEENDEKQA